MYPSHGGQMSRRGREGSIANLQRNDIQRGLSGCAETVLIQDTFTIYFAK